MNWDWLAARAEWVLQQALTIQQIPAPTFQETKRAAHVARQFKTLGLKQVDIDAESNVYGLSSGTGTTPAIMIVAHTDTVFPDTMSLETRVEDNLIFGPGLGDNSMGVAALLGLAATLTEQGITPDRDIWFVATSGEEGLGDLRGMKTAFARLQSDIGMVINVEGLALGHIYNAGIAVRRLHITATAPGGHSWLHFGRPSAVHAIVELGAQITSIRPPQKPRTTFNIGVIDGGTTINTIATRASMWLDLRSDSTDALAELEQQVRAHIESLSGPEVSFSVEVVGNRPAGQIDPDHPLVQAAQCALELTGRRSTLETGSTDGNVSLAAGVPTVTVGVTQGGNAHRPDEYIEVEPVQSGLRQLILLTLAAASDPESPVIS